MPVTRTLVDFSAAGGTPTHVLDLPAYVAGSRLVVVACTTAAVNPTATPPSPGTWTQIASIRASTTASGVWLAAWYRDQDGTEGSTVTVTLSIGGNCDALLYKLTGHDATAPVVESTNGGASAVGSQAVTITQSGSGEHACLHAYAVNNSSDPDITLDAGVTEDADLISGAVSLAAGWKNVTANETFDGSISGGLTGRTASFVLQQLAAAGLVITTSGTAGALAGTSSAEASVRTVTGAAGAVAGATAQDATARTSSGGAGATAAAPATSSTVRTASGTAGALLGAPAAEGTTRPTQAPAGVSAGAPAAEASVRTTAGIAGVIVRALGDDDVVTSGTAGAHAGASGVSSTARVTAGTAAATAAATATSMAVRSTTGTALAVLAATAAMTTLRTTLGIVGVVVGATAGLDEPHDIILTATLGPRRWSARLEEQP